MSRAFRAVLYDFDGTLVDSAESSFQCYLRTFERLGVPFDRTVFERTYSPNWLHTYAAVGLPRERWNDADAIWLEQYAAVQTPLIDGADGVMRRLAQAGIVQGLVTSGSRSRISRDLTQLGLATLLDVVICSEDVQHKKPHPEGLVLALDRLGVAAEDAAYVGDSPEDVHMARAAGVYSIGIPGKYPNREALNAAGADHYVGSLADLVPLLTPLERER